MTTTSEVVLVACLVRQQLLQHVVVTVRQYAAEEFIVAVDGQLRRRWIVGTIETKPNKCFNALLICSVLESDCQCGFGEGSQLASRRSAVGEQNVKRRIVSSLHAFEELRVQFRGTTNFPRSAKRTA